jgi:hypothetical protein
MIFPVAMRRIGELYRLQVVHHGPVRQGNRDQHGPELLSLCDLDELVNVHREVAVLLFLYRLFPLRGPFDRCIEAIRPAFQCGDPPIRLIFPVPYINERLPLPHDLVAPVVDNRSHISR